MQNYKLTIQYDGSRYSGWQVQGNTEQTVQGKLQRVLGALDGGEVEVHGSGRTDAGVHARAQIANVRLRTEPDCAAVLEYCWTAPGHCGHRRRARPGALSRPAERQSQALCLSHLEQPDPQRI